MKLSRALFFFAALTSCGRSENENIVGNPMQGQPPAKGSVSSDSGVTGKNLGLSGLNGFQYGSAVTGLRTNIDMAFKSFVNYENASGKRCSGVFATDLADVFTGYDVDGLPIYNSQRFVYFYSARHCFETWTPIGIRSEFTVKVNLPKSYNSPWMAINVFTPSIVVSGPERFAYNDGRGSDILRILQPDKNVNNFLPLCESDVFGTAKYDANQAVGYTNPRQTTNPGVVWANTSVAVPSEMPAPMQNLMNSATDSKSYRWANGVKASPGDSGSPIWGIKRAPDGVGVDRYTCLAGIVTRELWKNEGCDSITCKMRGEAVFEKVKGYLTTAGYWKTF